MQSRPENLITPKRRAELKERLEALGLSRRVLQAAEVELMANRRNLNALLYEFVGKAIPVKGRAVSIEFAGGFKSSLELYFEIPAENYTVGPISRYQVAKDHPETMTVVRLSPAEESDIRCYLAVADTLEFATLAEVNATQRKHDAATRGA